MTYPTLKIIHITGLALVFMGLTGVLALKMAGAAPGRQRWIFHAAHGGGLILVLATGIGLGMKLGLTHPAPFWVIGKFIIWLLAGSAMVLAVRFSRFAGPILLYLAALVFAAAWLAIYKP
ncbi:MAG TPA: hypothetical protein VL527_16220 [Dongiaceae bacterium]|nr:hypothetical protein [Dongiaceae bacterium]